MSVWCPFAGDRSNHCRRRPRLVAQDPVGWRTGAHSDIARYTGHRRGFAVARVRTDDRCEALGNLLCERRILIVVAYHEGRGKRLLMGTENRFEDVARGG